ncbi:MAG: hypothetical protein M1833_006187 [Piccolia ochrophora]|nr:MAG: hypothetical protein M1833_006187 [Piccolia ochrophora]
MKASFAAVVTLLSILAASTPVKRQTDASVAVTLQIGSEEAWQAIVPGDSTIFLTEGTNIGRAGVGAEIGTLQGTAERATCQAFEDAEATKPLGEIFTEKNATEWSQDSSAKIQPAAFICSSAA